MGVVWLATLVYFPAGPPTPPSLSRSVDNPPFFTGFMQLCKSGRFWVLALAFGIPEGVGSGWLAMLGPNMQAHHFSQDDAGWVGFSMTVAGCIAGIGAGQILDIPSLARKKKSMVIVLYSLCAAAATVFALGCVRSAFSDRVLHSRMPLLPTRLLA
jgi:FLVCR family MFS transporter